MPPRLYVDLALSAGAELPLPPDASRHVQVLRLQPGAPLCLFNGAGGQWPAEVVEMGRKSVTVRVLAFQALDRELPVAVTLALAMPANERMDMVVEKATELGAAALQPLMAQRSVLRLAGERAQRKAAHWQAIARSACEQSGRNRVPAVAEPQAFDAWLAGAMPPGAAPPLALLLSLAERAVPLAQALLAEPWWQAQQGPGAQEPAQLEARPSRPVLVLSGPEGGLTPDEQAAAQARGFVPVSLGPRVLRADTAPLAALACIAALAAAG